MKNIVLVRKEKIDYGATNEKALVRNSISELALESDMEPKTFVLPLTEQNLRFDLNERFNTFIPSTKVTSDQVSSGRLYVYFDLENYPFYKKLSEAVKKEARRKGVFRLKRTVNYDEDILLIASDLYVLAELFGEPDNVIMKHSNRAKNPYHIILMVNFSGGTMSHLEYTFSDHESMEFDWSGVKKIIEFNSKEMSPIKPNNLTDLPLTYNADAIVASAHLADQNLIEQLNKFRYTVEEGVRQ
ncbi:hypothetical protein [Virgibacillus oceani]|uniref:Uncharacterized protein n=1 Tax=Virgibacillus oceani TaxID=1479511 RepID=A0A917M1F2_9BACI|nr:hypothetical protein [Virgibacillus oceani]GGG72999.1 hypothetical protein GCM10011398_16760 [Virgibacillus oceani]